MIAKPNHELKPLPAPAISRPAALSISLPFEPVLTPRVQLENELAAMLRDASNQLCDHFPQEVAQPLLKKLKRLVRGLNFGTHTKSLALFVEAKHEAVFYWNMPVQPKVLVSNACNLRQLLRYKKEERNFLLLSFSRYNSGIYLGNPQGLTRILAGSPLGVAGAATPNQLQCRLRRLDGSLGLLLQAFPLPVLVAGSTDQLHLFRQLTRHQASLAGSVPMDFDYVRKERLFQLIKPLLQNWGGLYETFLLQQLEAAQQAGKLSAGIDEIWQAAPHRQNRLLLVEEGYRAPAYLHTDNSLLHAAVLADAAPVRLNDAVTQVIENMLAEGVAVEFVRKGLLNDALHMALLHA